MEFHESKDDSYWFFAREDENSWIYFLRPRGRGVKAKRFNLTRVLQRDAGADTYTDFGYVSDAGAALHSLTPRALTRAQAEEVGRSFLEAAREADDDLVKWPS